MIKVILKKTHFNYLQPSSREIRGGSDISKGSNYCVDLVTIHAHVTRRLPRLTTHISPNRSFNVEMKKINVHLSANVKQIPLLNVNTNSRNFLIYVFINLYLKLRDEYCNRYFRSRFMVKKVCSFYCRWLYDFKN